MRKKKTTIDGLMCNNWTDTHAPVLVIKEQPAKDLFKYIRWKRLDYPKNRVEQGGWMIGYYIYGEHGNIRQAVVTHVLPATLCSATPISLDWPALQDIRLQRLFFDMKEQMAATDPVGAEKLALIGWFHTHPNKLDVFLSSVDLENIRRKFNHPDQFSIVLNPHRLIWKAYRGVSGEDCNAVMLVSNTKKHKKRKSKQTKKMKYVQKKQKKAEKHRRKHK